MFKPLPTEEKLPQVSRTLTFLYTIHLVDDNRSTVGLVGNAVLFLLHPSGTTVCGGGCPDTKREGKLTGVPIGFCEGVTFTSICPLSSEFHEQGGRYSLSRLMSPDLAGHGSFQHPTSQAVCSYKFLYYSVKSTEEQSGEYQVASQDYQDGIPNRQCATGDPRMSLLWCLRAPPATLLA